MLAETASWSWVWRPGSMLAGSMWPKDRVRGSRTSTGTGSVAASDGTKKVSSSKRARGWGAQHVGPAGRPGPGLRAAWASPTGTRP